MKKDCKCTECQCDKTDAVSWYKKVLIKLGLASKV